MYKIRFLKYHSITNFSTQNCLNLPQSFLARDETPILTGNAHVFKHVINVCCHFKKKKKNRKNEFSVVETENVYLRGDEEVRR